MRTSLLLSIVVSACAGAHEPVQVAQAALPPRPQPIEEPPPRAEPVPEPTPEPPVELGDTIDLACGVARARIPASMHPAPPQARPNVHPAWEAVPCRDEEYLQEVRAERVRGGVSEQTIAAGACEIEVRVSESRGDPSPASPLALRGSSATADVSTPLGTSLSIEVDAENDECDASVSALARAILGSIEHVAPSPGRARAELSSAGHGIELELPEGWRLDMQGGMADAYESAFALRAPGGGTATFYTSWTAARPIVMPPSRFRARVLPARVRYADGEDPVSGESCAAITTHPDPAVDVGILFCGPESDRAPILEVLRGAHFLPPTRVDPSSE